jgi:N-methylhydantoinase A
MSARPGMVIGIDIGGTFTDFALLDSTSGDLYIGKRLTTPDDPGRALLAGMDELCRRAGIAHADLDRVSHATTLVTNAIIERKGSVTGLLVTEGFRDILVMGRESRYDHYDFRFERPEPLVPRSLTAEVTERMAWNDRVLKPLDPDSVRAAVAGLVDAGVVSLAVCLLHAYRNPAHERAISALVAAEFPQLDCTVSSEVASELREYERASTTVANAYIRPRVSQYLAQLDGQLRDRGFRKQVHIMLSNGGISSTEVARKIPIQLIESGPAAGALAAALYANLLGIKQVLAFDMGGTTAKLCCIENGRPYHANTFETARARRFRRGSGLPLMIPVIELIEIGAGGGSIAHIDKLGLLKVGPTSAGAKPGPAAYGLGGTQPTVTDADVLLGYIDPARFLGGDMQLDKGAAERAVGEHIAVPLNRTAVEAAWGMFCVVNEAMVAAGKRYAAEKALDIRKFTLITFGGAAPIHAWQVARILGITEIVFPMGAGAISAVGLCVAAPVVNLSNSLIGALDGMSWSRVSALYVDMERRAVDMLASAGAQAGDITVERSVDIRYSGQGYEIEVPVTGVDFGGNGAEVLAQVRQRFEETYARHYGRALDGGAMEAVTWRIKASGVPLSLRLKPQVPASAQAAAQLTPSRGQRPAYFGPELGFVGTPVYDRYRLAAGDEGVGPALVEERETTIVIDPGTRWRVDEFLNLHLQRRTTS